MKLHGDDIEITKDTSLNIFKNSKFNGEKIIAPKSKGSYTFCIKNISEKDVVYGIEFLDEMQYPINMKYRLKIDNVYIKGNEDTYISINELSIDDIIVLEDSINVFTLEWYWEDDDKNDTMVGKQDRDQYYTLNLEIYAEEYEKQR